MIRNSWKSDWFWLIVLGAIVLRPAALAGAADGSGSPAATIAPSYRLGPGDVLEVAVPTHEGFNASLPVQPDGRIYYPIVGEIQVTGMTVPELTERIQRGLEKELRAPRVTVSVREVRPGVRRVTITGAVRSQGAVDARENWRVSDALAAAGGPTEKADLKHVTFWHTAQAESLDLSAWQVDGRLEHNPSVTPGDILIVPERPRVTVSVTGEGVRNPSSFEMDDPEPTVLKALQKAGGYSERADLRKAWVMRAGGKPEPLDLEALIQRGEMKLNLTLGNGDTIHVPAMEAKAFVFGEVSRPDAVPLKPDYRVLDVISVVAPTHEANLDRAVLVRKQPDGTPKAQALRLGRLNHGDMSVNLPMQNGDVILIPAKGKKLSIQDMLQILYPIDILRRMLGRGY
jgi:protein involved in polysaccharide export with SLBB domain